MTQSNEIEVHKPRNILHKQIDINFKSLLLTVAQGTINCAFLKWDDLAENGVQLLDSLGLKDTPEERAGLLIIRALTAAIKNLLDSNIILFNNTQPENPKELFKSLSNALNDTSICIDDEFFTYPKNSPLIYHVKTVFLEWLKPFLDNSAEAESISNRLPEYFVYALTKEWQNNKDDYLILTEQLDTPFTKADKREHSWSNYRAWLQLQIQEPVFLESFSLKEIYIPLRAYYQTNDNKNTDLSRKHQEENPTGLNQNKHERIVVNVSETLEAWVNKADKNDAIRLLTGGPGSGKSSLTKIFAARLAETNNIPVLYIPLHRFNLKDDLVKAVGEFVKFDGFLTENPLDPDNTDLRLLIIFDGLDELSKQGKIAQEVASEFVQEVRNKVRDFNIHKTRLQVLISGREVIIQADLSKFRQEEQLLYLCPYFVSETDKKKLNYKDEENLLDQDQRNDWWQLYGKLKGKNYQGLPEALNQDDLTEITVQPLLNYLIALSYERKKIEFTSETNLNKIYHDLLEAVYKRGYETERKGHPAIEGITQKDFVTILQEIALACWHGDGRTTTVKEIEKHCENSGLKDLLTRFQESFKSDSPSSITRLLTAFYFREAGNIREAEKTFEFTHKSFGEYLTALRIVETVKLIDGELRDKKNYYQKRWDEKTALVEWIKVCGYSVIDFDLFDFIINEIRLRDANTVEKWQESLCNLIGFMLHNGMPMEHLVPRPSFQEEMKQSRNAEEALLGVLNACARVTKKVSNIDFPTLESFGEWIGRLLGQRKDSEKVFVMECLSFLNLQKCTLYIRDFYQANLEGAILEGAILVDAILQRANLKGANLKGANLLDAKLQGAKLQGANLQGANLQRAILQRAILQRAILQRANLQGANLEGAKLQGANLQGANLQGANLQWANLQWAENITEEQIETARNWEQAKFDSEFALE